MGSQYDRANPSAWKREARRDAEIARWNKLTPEEKEKENLAKEERRLALVEARRVREEKEAARIERYMKTASSITIPDFFKSKQTRDAKVTVFCRIRGYTDHQIEVAKNKAESLHGKVSKEAEIKLMISYLKILCMR